MNEIYLIIRTLVAGIAGVKWVDKDYGQIDHYDNRPSVQFPCVLIKMNFPTLESITRKTQLCTGVITLRVAIDNVTRDTSAAAPQTATDRDLQYTTIADAIYKQLQGYTNSPFNNFDRISFGDETRTDGIGVVKMVFNCSFVDSSAEGLGK